MHWARTTILVYLAIMSGTVLADSPLPTAPHVYVQGSASVNFAPDWLSLSVSYFHTNMDVSIAKESVDSRSSRLLNVCDELGIKREDLQSTGLQISPETEYENGKTQFIGTKVARTVTVVLNDLSQYSNLMSGVLSSDPNSIGSTSLSSKKSSDKIREAQELAIADARERASGLARATNRGLGEAYSISEFNLRQKEAWSLIPSRRITQQDGETSAGFARGLPIRSGEIFEPGLITATAEVFVVYLLK